MSEPTKVDVIGVLEELVSTNLDIEGASGAIRIAIDRLKDAHRLALGLKYGTLAPDEDLVLIDRILAELGEGE